MAIPVDQNRSRAAERGAGSESQPGGRSSSDEDVSFSEAIDRRTGSIRARGRLDGRAADMLSGSVQALHRSGWGPIVLDLGGVRAVDGVGLQALHSLQSRIAADGGHVALLNEPQPGVD